MIKKERSEMREETISKENVTKYWLNSTMTIMTKWLKKTTTKKTEIEPKSRTNETPHWEAERIAAKAFQGPCIDQEVKSID